MISVVPGAFGVDTSLGLGTQIYALVIKKNFSDNTYVSNGLINMYFKCWDMEDSIEVFSQMSGDGSKALQLYEEMRLKAIQPTNVTFLSLLHP